MKKIYQIAAFYCFLMTLVSCYEDLGNYNYRAIGGVEVTFVQDTFSVMQGDSLKICPQLTFGGNSVETDFDYEWEAIVTDRQVGVDSILRFKIGDKRDLNFFASLRSRAKPYKLYLYVTEKATGVRHYFNTYMEVASAVGRGCVVLCDVAGKARLDIISMSQNDTLVIPDILTVIDAGMPMNVGAPLSLMLFRDGIPYQYSVNTTTGCFVIDQSTLMYTYPIDWIFFSDIPSPFYVRSIFKSSTYEYVLSGDGNCYYKNSSNMGSGFGEAVNCLKAKQDSLIPMSHHLAYAAHYTSVNDRGINKRYLYDIKGQRFLEHTSPTASYLTPIVRDKTHTLFNFAAIGKELVAICNTRFIIPGKSWLSPSYAIFRDEAKTWLYVFEVPGAAANRKSKQHYVHELPEEANHSSLYTVDDKTGFLYYSDGKGIYAWNVLTGKELTDIGSVTEEGEEISYLQYMYVSYLKQYLLIVGTYRPDSVANTGRLAYYKIDGLTGGLTTTGKSFRGVGKIVDIMFK